MSVPLIRYNVDPKWAQNLRKRKINMCKKNKSIEQEHDEQSKNLIELKIGEVYCRNTRNEL